MGRKIRKQVTLTEEQAAALARRAKELGVSESEVIRKGLEYVCTVTVMSTPALEPPKSIKEELKSVQEQVDQLPAFDEDSEPLPKTMDDLIAWLRRRAEKYPGLNQPRTWKREDAYEGRI